MPHRLTVADVMTRELLTLAEDDTLADARRLMMRGRLRHLPVVRDGRLVGLVTHRDLLSASFSVFADVSALEERQVFARIPVRELMHDAVTATPSMSVREAARVLLDNKFGCLPVVGADDALVGMVTDSDFLVLTVRMLEALEA